MVSGLVLNFVPDPALAVRELTRVTRAGGRVAAYVWDYAGRMELIRHFWDAAAAVDPAAAELDEGRRFGLCQPEPLGRLFGTPGWPRWTSDRSRCRPRFRDFDATGARFLGGSRARAGETVLDEPGGRPREELRRRLPVADDGSTHWSPGLGGARAVLTACLVGFISIC